MLPTSKTPAIRNNPKRLVFFGKPKIGKTTLLSQLPGCLILDLENGTDHLEALKLKVVGLMPPANENPAMTKARKEAKIPKYYLTEVSDLIQDHRKANKGEYPYQYIAIDTITELEEWCVDHATTMYMNSIQGKGFNRDMMGQLLPKDKQETVLSLPNGAGYRWLRDSFTYWLSYIDKMAPNIILVGHVREKSVTKEGKEVNVNDLDLTGKISSITAAASDAIAFIYRSGNKTYLNFAAKDVVCGSRCAHLKGKDILIMEEDPKTQKIQDYWKEIYID